jgi:hypothetical protein
MATPADVIAQTSSINLISKSISATRSSVSITSDSVSKIQKIIATKTTIRNELFFKNQTLASRRREASKRRELEDQIEASKVTTNIQSGLRTTSASSQGPLGRILSFLGYMGAGWIVENLPTWIAMGQEFIARMKKAGEIIYSIPNTMWRILQGFGNVLGITGKNILSLDFTDSSDGIKNSFAELIDTIELLGTQITDGFKLMLQPSGEVDIPSTGEQQPDTGFPDVPPVPSPDGGREGSETSGGRVSPQAVYSYLKQLGVPEIHALGILANIEGESGFQIGVQEKGDSKQGVGLFQYTFPSRKSAFLKAVPDYKTNWKGQIDFAIKSDPNTPLYLKKQFNSPESAAEDFMRNWENPDPRVYTDRRRKHNAFIKNFKPSSSQSQTQTPTAPPRPVSTGTMNLIPQTGPGGFIQGGSGSGGETTYATHFHIDSKSKNPTAEQLANIREVAFQAAKAMIGRGSTVYFGNIKQYASKNDSTLKNQIVAEQRAHDARSSAGVDIQESNPRVKPTFPSQPGSATKFPFAVGEVYYRGGYGREAEIIGSSGITVSHGASGSKSSGVSLKPSSISPQTSRFPSERELQSSTLEQQPQIYSLSPEERKQVAEAVEASRRGQEIIFIDDRSVSQPSAPSVSRSSYGGGSSGQMTEFDMLNKFMKQKLLLDFNYL